VHQPIDYVSLAAEHAVTGATWDAFVRTALVDRWISEYEARLAGAPRFSRSARGI
jgi:hypothetical protein